MTTVMTTDRCPICGYEGFRDNRIHIVNGELCLLRQNAALREALVAIRRCGVECSECRDEIDNALRPYEQTEVADDA